MEHLKFARAYLTGAENWLIQVRKQDTTFYERQMFATMAEVLSHLEAQQETPASAIQASPNGSVVIERQGETRRILTTSSALSFPVSRDGIDLPLVTQAITDWVSSQWLVGGALEVEIGLTFTSKGRIRPAGSVSPSTTLTPQPEIASNSSSGAHGMDARPESLSASGPDSPASSPEPAQGGSEEHELRVGFDSILYWLDAIREINAGHEGHYQYPLENIRRIASYYAAPLTNHEGRE